MDTARRSSSLSRDFIILHSSLGEAQNSFDISVAGPPADMNLPAISPNGVVESAGFSLGWPLVPGGMISVFGSRLAPAEAFATSMPLPRQLGGVSLSIAGEDVPLFFVGPSQINAQVPLDYLIFRGRDDLGTGAKTEGARLSFGLS